MPWSRSAKTAAPQRKRSWYEVGSSSALEYPRRIETRPPFRLSALTSFTYEYVPVQVIGDPNLYITIAVSSAERKNGAQNLWRLELAHQAEF